jgi:hypothetical protein
MARMSEDYYPLPWSNLKYDTNLGGYRVGVTEDQLRAHPNTLIQPSGIGRTGLATARSTITTKCPFGTEHPRAG